jgi:hypothetical protein
VPVCGLCYAPRSGEILVILSEREAGLSDVDSGHSKAIVHAQQLWVLNPEIAYANGPPPRDTA